MKAVFFAACLIAIAFTLASAQPVWKADLDSKVRFYQTTDFGLILVGTQRSLYAVDGETGVRLWRVETGAIGETAITPIPNTDVILLSRDLGSKSRLEAVDVMTGMSLWQSEKVKGDVLQLAVDPENDLVAVVLVKDPHGATGSEFKRKPIVHVLRMSNGEELWKRELDSDIEMMPARFGDNIGEVSYTLDNYRAPLLLDGRLFLFYEGSTSYDALTGKEKEREKFKVNEDGLALTEADPVIDATHIYTSGRGKVRAVNRKNGQVDWRADDLGTASEMALLGDTLFIRTGGRFTRLKDGESESKGPYGISAVDTATGKTKWRFKGADKGITNFVFADTRSIVIADRDEVTYLDAANGKPTVSFPHKVDHAEFVLINESGSIVVGGRDTIAAFAGEGPRRNERAGGPNTIDPDTKVRELWRVRHKAPGRGALRIVGGIALRAAALYFRYGGVATSAFGLARNGLSFANAVNSFRWSGLRSRFGSFDLTTLASNSAKDYLTSKFYSYGAIARTPGMLNRVPGLQIQRPGASMLGRVVPSRAEVKDSVIDRLDPVRQVERLSGYLLKKKRLSELKGNYMYFYTDLPKPFDRKGMIGVNVHNGRDSRFILASDPDEQFLTDDITTLFYTADGSRLQAFEMLDR